MAQWTQTEFIRAALQKLLDADNDGWQLNQFVLSFGLERMNSDGTIETTAWVWSPAEQPEWVTDGLLRAAVELREISDIDTD